MLPAEMANKANPGQDTGFAELSGTCCPLTAAVSQFRDFARTPDPCPRMKRIMAGCFLSYIDQLMEGVAGDSRALPATPLLDLATSHPFQRNPL